MNPITRPRLLVAAGLLAVLLVAGATACSGGDQATPRPAGGAVAEEPAQRDGMAASQALDSDEAGDADAAGAEPADLREPAVISIATVSLRADDVLAARDRVDDVIADYGGTIAHEQTSGGEDARRAEVTIRVPADDFQDALADLSGIGELERSSQQAEDVTSRVIDVRAKIRAQERSLRRVELLLDRASSIRDIITIERQLADRQAKLDSLKQRRAYLADQTSMSTITVRIERSDRGEDDEDDAGGFLGGLEAGWKALVGFGTGILTILGAVLPFAVVIAVLGAPLWLLLRRRWRRPPVPAPSPGQSNG